jgi:hypothetical protein
MKKKLKKTAAGTVLHNSSPDAIEEVLVSEIENAVGKWKDVVNIKPYLRIDDTDGDLSGNVKDAFGAIELNVYGAKLYIPFIIADKTLLPFDTIRMGEEEVSYDYAKLRRIVNAIEHKVKKKQELGDEDNPFETMEIAKFEDVPYDNGFLGTIMEIRDTHRAKDVLGDEPWSGPGFGMVDMARVASEGVDVLDTFHSVMDKIAKVKVYTQEQLDSFEEHIKKKAEKEALEELKKAASIPETLEKKAVERNMERLSEEKLFNVHRAASGNNIAFPVFHDSQLEYRMGRVYSKFASLVLSGDHDYESGKIGALVLDSKGGYCFLTPNEPFMASTNSPSAFDLPTERARGMEVGHMYSFEKDTTTLFNPFTIERSYLQNSLNDGIVISVRERASNDSNIPSRVANSLFFDVFECKEAMPGRSKNSNFLSSWSKPFSIVVTKDANFTEPAVMDEQQINTYITQHAKDPADAKLAKSMLLYSDSYVLLPSNFPLFKMQQSITNFYTRPDGLFKEGPLAKTAASYQEQNKATLYLQQSRNPKTYAIEWTFTRKDSAREGVAATKLEKRRNENLSKAEAESMLNKLGYDFRTQKKFFEIAHRNGRSATFKLPNPQLAAKTAVPDSTKDKVKRKMQGVANSMLNSRNFMPLLEEGIGSTLAAGIGTTMPSAVDGVHKINEFFNTASSMETAVEMEKLATNISGAHWHELSALTNLKYQLDKLSSEIYEGNYLYNAKPVFEKVAEFKPVIKEKVGDLIEFNRKQLLKTSSYLVSPQLIKEAVQQLDGLYEYATFMDKKAKKKRQLTAITKEAGLFRPSPQLKATSEEINKLKNNLIKSHRSFDYANNRLRAVIDEGTDPPKVQKAIEGVEKAKKDLDDNVSGLKTLYQQQGDMEQQNANRNRLLMGGIGLPGIVGLSYGYENLKDK